ncbi:acyltransferase [Polaribacter aquimarinus]|uniref:Acyltransferase n=1 Tax=Polaribacter aquimarinus TaxID=2100726 RepID=A0A2U2JDE9_9FLAO|nr:acyltransferase [Polaribacter aquimarinus]
MKLKSLSLIQINNHIILKTIWYYFWKLFLKIGLHFYSKKIIVSGKEQIPKKGAVLFMVNHPNGLIDPLMVTTHLPRINHYLVRAAVFKKPLIKKFLGTLNLMPIYRIRDGASQLGKNQEIFENCFEIFKKGQTLMIFPEGSHNRKRTIRPLSKGFTRIVFGALDKYKDLKITIIPVGLTYQNASQYPAKVAINYGTPILVNDFYNPKKTNISVVQLKNEVSFQLKKLSVHIPDDESYKEVLAKLNKANVDFTQVESVNKMIVNQSFLELKPKTTHYLKPLFYLIIINSLLPYIIWKITSKKIDEIEFIDTFRFGLNAVTFPVFYIFQSLIIQSFWGWRIAGVYFFISLLLILIHSKFSVTNSEV